MEQLLLQTKNASKLVSLLVRDSLWARKVDFDLVEVWVNSPADLHRVWKTLGGGPSYRPWQLLTEVNGNVAEEGEA